jgi:hypothetical protein
MPFSVVILEFASSSRIGEEFGSNQCQEHTRYENQIFQLFGFINKISLKFLAAAMVEGKRRHAQYLKEHRVLPDGGEISDRSDLLKTVESLSHSKTEGVFFDHFTVFSQQLSGFPVVHVLELSPLRLKPNSIYRI